MKFFKPENLKELSRITKGEKRKIYFLSGCTDFYVYYKDGMIDEENSVFIDISSIKELKGIRETKKEILIGATTSFTDIIESKILNRYFPVLIEASKAIGSTQIRNRATIGGNIANSSPAGDSIPALFVHNAELELIKDGNKRVVPVEKFFTGVKQNILKNGEIIKNVILPKKTFNKFVFKKIGPRKALSISKVSMALVANVKDKIIKEIAISYGAVYKTVVRCRKAENFLKGKRINDSVIQEAKKLALEVISPITDFRSTALYRFKIAEVFLERALKEISN